MLVRSSDVVTSEIVWFAFGFGGKTRPTVERQKGRSRMIGGGRGMWEWEWEWE